MTSPGCAAANAARMSACSNPATVWTVDLPPPSSPETTLSRSSPAAAPAPPEPQAGTSTTTSTSARGFTEDRANTSTRSFFNQALVESVVALAQAEDVGVERAFAFLDDARARVGLVAVRRAPGATVQADRPPGTAVLVDADPLRTGAARSVGEGLAHPFLDASLRAVVVGILVVGAEGAGALRDAGAGAVVAADLPLGAGRVAARPRAASAIIVATACEECRDQEQDADRAELGHVAMKGKARATTHGSRSGALRSSALENLTPAKT